MNKQIKKLADEAGLYIAYDNRAVTDKEIEFFAELIVKECLNQCERIRSDAATQKGSDFLTESGKTLYEGVYGGATNCGFAIQQHFGIEE